MPPQKIRSQHATKRQRRSIFPCGADASWGPQCPGSRHALWSLLESQKKLKTGPPANPAEVILTLLEQVAASQPYYYRDHSGGGDLGVVGALTCGNEARAVCRAIETRRSLTDCTTSPVVTICAAKPKRFFLCAHLNTREKRCWPASRVGRARIGTTHPRPLIPCFRSHSID